MENIKTVDSSKEAFQTFVANFDNYKDSDLSESDTRSKLIDFLLIEILGWNEKDIEREGFNKSAGFYDYRVSSPSFSFIFEAKKNFNSLVFPKKNKKVKLKSLYSENQEVIEQIRGYIIEEGLQIGVISNGHQFIIAKFVNTDGTKWKDNKAIIFHDMDDISSRFIEFYNLISKTAVISNSTIWLEEEADFEGKTVLSTIDNPDKEILRNSLTSSMTSLMEKVFGEIFSSDSEEDDEKLIEECFVSNTEIKKNRSEIEKLFADRAPSHEGIIPAVNTDSIIKQISCDIQNNEVSVNSPAPKPIIIIGSKGAGKTTFIKYLFKFSLDKDIRLSHPVVYLDFRKYTPKDIQDTHEKIFDEMLDFLDMNFSELGIFQHEVLKKAYKKEINRNNKSIWLHLKEDTEEYKRNLADFFKQKMSEKESHFISISQHLVKNRKKRICVIFDNADQLDFETQKNAFLFAHSLNEKAKCGIILSLREGFYSKWKNRPPFDAYYSHVYHISAAKYGEILQKRIDFAINEVKNNQERISGEGRLISGADIEMPASSVTAFLSSARQTLFSRENSEMLEFLNQTTYPNIREGLKVFRHFLLSGHTQVEQYVTRHWADPDSQIPIPIHEFVKAIALDNKLIYSSHNSVVYNLFKPEYPSSKDHFIKLKILRFFNDIATSSNKSEHHVLMNKVIDTFEENGYLSEHIQAEVTSLIKSNLLETSNTSSDTPDEIDFSIENSFAITLKGYYYSKILVNRFHYIELIAQDTPIFNKEAFDKINSVYQHPNDKGTSRLDSRLAFVQCFVEYLQKMEKKSGSTAIETQEILNHGLKKDYDRLESIIKK